MSIHCDLCHAFIEVGEQVYTYFTPSTGTREEGVKGTAFWCEDPEWAVCPECAAKIDALDEARLSFDDWVVEVTTRSIMNQGIVIAGDEETTKKLMDAYIGSVAGVLKSFATHKLPERRAEIHA